MKLDDDAHDPERDAQMDAGGQILGEAIERMAEAGVSDEPVITLFLLSASYLAIGDASTWTDHDLEMMAQGFAQHAEAAFRRAAERLRDATDVTPDASA